MPNVSARVASGAAVFGERFQKPARQFMAATMEHAQRAGAFSIQFEMYGQKRMSASIYLQPPPTRTDSEQQQQQQQQPQQQPQPEQCDQRTEQMDEKKRFTVREPAKHAEKTKKAKVVDPAAANAGKVKKAKVVVPPRADKNALSARSGARDDDDPEAKPRQASPALPKTKLLPPSMGDGQTWSQVVRKKGRSPPSSPEQQPRPKSPRDSEAASESYNEGSEYSDDDDDDMSDHG